MKHKLIVCILAKGLGESATQLAKDYGATGGTLALARGTAENAIIQLLGLGDSSKDIAFILVDDAKASGIVNAIHEEMQSKKHHYGVVLCFDVNRLYKSGESTKKDGGVEMDNGKIDFELIQAIVNKGCAEDVMAVARKAGAKGGTVLNARGTAKEDEATFFGVQLVPEKEVVLIVAESAMVKDVFDAICELKCLSEKGSGIVFRLPITDYKVPNK